MKIVEAPERRAERDGVVEEAAQTDPVAAEYIKDLTKTWTTLQMQINY